MATTARPTESADKQRRLLTERALNAAKQGHWEEALAANQELLALSPKAAEVQNRIGKALSELGRPGEAHAAYQRATELEPHNQIAQRNLRRLETIKGLSDTMIQGHPLVRSYLFIEETGKTATVSVVRPADAVTRAQMMAGDPLELRIDAAANHVAVHSIEGVYLGEIEPRIAERLVEMTGRGNRYTASVLEHEEDTLRIMLREIYQDPSLSDRLSFPTRVRGAAPRAYIRKDILFDAMEDTDLVGDSEDDDVETEEPEEEPEVEDEEFSDDDLEETGI